MNKEILLRRGSKTKSLRTKRLYIMPMTDDELMRQIVLEKDEHLRLALSEMLAGCKEHPKHRDWYTAWQIKLRENGEQIGSLGFRGLPESGRVEIGYGIDEPYRNQGYAYEAVQSVVEWAFTQSGVHCVTAEAEADNGASLRILKNLGFVECGTGLEGLRFVKVKTEEKEL